ncbi:ligase-associated DNA damage response DEXH box helicase [Fulvivirgaceae bacterium LMO-SS25]
MSDSLGKLKDWFSTKNWKSQAFQEACWEAIYNGKSGVLNAPTGSGKTYAIWLGCLLPYLNNTRTYRKGLKIIWVTPLRALSADIHAAMQSAVHELGLPWEIAMRTGDTDTKERQRQKRNPPDAMITTPESLHLLLSQKGASKWFENLECIVADEWHELLGTKRGVQLELALSRLKKYAKPPTDSNHAERTLQIWGISATIGNMEEAMEVLLGPNSGGEFVRSNIKKQIEVESILPDEIEKYPWAGHLGIKMLDKILPIIEKSHSTLMFTNTRSQTEIWYQQLMEKEPQLAGLVAMHHGSLDSTIRNWVEDRLHQGKLKLVVCTSSLDLGVDFRPVETVIQVGGPKGIARFVQRAGRAGHQPGVPSKIYFLPTHSLELIEAAALRNAIDEGLMEGRKPLINCFDVLIQYLVTLAIGDGFDPNDTFKEVKSTYCYQNLKNEEWSWILQFLISGGESLGSYEEFSKIEPDENGIFRVENRKTAMRHRLSMGTIVGDPILKVKYLTGGFIGTIEESFISLIKKGDVFWFAGRSLEFIQVKDLTVLVKRSKRKTNTVPRWMGGRMNLSSLLSNLIRNKLQEAYHDQANDIELKTIAPLLIRQQTQSIIPEQSVLLIEKLRTKEGYHVFIFPFEGRFTHEILASIIAYRISQSQAISFSIAMNDYGFELLSDIPIPIEDALELDLFSEENLDDDLIHTINNTDLAKRRFRDIATIAGLIFQGFPGKNISFKHLHASSGILFDVFEEYDPENLLLKQAREEVINLQINKTRLFEAVHRINQQKIVIKNTLQPGPFAFPIMADRLRDRLSSESIEERVAKLQAELEKL